MRVLWGESFSSFFFFDFQAVQYIKNKNKQIDKEGKKQRQVDQPEILFFYLITVLFIYLFVCLFLYLAFWLLNYQL